MGKENGKAIPTQEEYIAEQIEAKRKAALDKSRNRTSVRVPMVANSKTEEEWRNRINDAIRYQEERLSRIMDNYDGYKKQMGIHFIQEEQEELDRLLEEKDKGYPKLVPGSNCMYNAGDCYGLNIPGNETFAAKHRQLGFKKAPKGSMEPGDLVQDVSMGYPTHAMIYDSKDVEGNLLFNYARGNVYSDFENSYVKQGKYSLPIKEMYNNKKAEGGSLFTNGVTTIGNGGTHEYLEGQEYDVTEEEIKLLKKLGYEFEYL